MSPLNKHEAAKMPPNDGLSRTKLYPARVAVPKVKRIKTFYRPDSGERFPELRQWEPLPVDQMRPESKAGVFLRSDGLWHVWDGCQWWNGIWGESQLYCAKPGGIELLLRQNEHDIRIVCRSLSKGS